MDREVFGWRAHGGQGQAYVAIKWEPGLSSHWRRRAWDSLPGANAAHPADYDDITHGSVAAVALAVDAGVLKPGPLPRFSSQYGSEASDADNGEVVWLGEISVKR